MPHATQKPVSMFSLRHGKTNPAADHTREADAARRLTDAGKDIVRDTGIFMQDSSLNFRPEALIVSSAARAQESAGIFLEVMGIKDIPTIMTDGLYQWSEMDESVKDIPFDANMMLYYNSEHDNREKHRQDLLQFERNRIRDAVQAFEDLGVNGQILVVSHAWVSNCVAMAYDLSGRDYYRQIVLPEAHGILITNGHRPLKIGPNGIVQ